MPKYRFRKVYFICEKNRIFPNNYEMVSSYRQMANALSVCSHQQRDAIIEAKKDYNKSRDIPLYKVEGFYLVHESLFDELLKKHSKE
jgi:hypothetical protein